VPLVSRYFFDSHAEIRAGYGQSRITPTSAYSLRCIGVITSIASLENMKQYRFVKVRLKLFVLFVIEICSTVRRKIALWHLVLAGVLQTGMNKPSFDLHYTISTHKERERQSG
jgi:hypothetical protein